MGVSRGETEVDAAEATGEGGMDVLGGSNHFNTVGSAKQIEEPAEDDASGTDLLG